MLGNDGACRVGRQRGTLVAQTVAGVPRRTRQKDVGIQHHIGGQMLPLVDFGTQCPLNPAEIRMFYGADERTVHIQLVPRHLVDGDHRLLHGTVIQRAPEFPFFVVTVGKRISHIPFGKDSQRFPVFPTNIHRKSPLSQFCQLPNQSEFPESAPDLVCPFS